VCRRVRRVDDGRKTDDLKGRVEEAAGDLTGGKRLKNEGSMDYGLLRG
jgi:uncharacterized protein YjbJ (UPF0337 family)